MITLLNADFQNSFTVTTSKKLAIKLNKYPTTTSLPWPLLQILQQGAYRTLKVAFQDLFMCVFHDFPGPFMSIFHVFPGLFNLVDIKQVGFSYHKQFITILNNRSNWVWQWTVLMYVKAENMYTGQKCGNHLVYFPWLSRI